MVLRTLHFVSNWPNEPDFDSEGNLIVPGARELATTIAAGFSSHAGDVSGLVQHSYYGWEFSCRFDGAKFYNVFNPADAEGYLTVQYLGYCLDAIRLRRPRIRLDSYCECVYRCLSKIPNLTDLTWVDS